MSLTDCLNRTLPGEAEQRWSARSWGILAVLCLVLFMDSLDGSMVGIALPSIGHALGMGPTSLQWIIDSYFLGYGGLLLLGGRTGDLLGHRRVLLIALGVSVVVSLLGGLVTSGSLLIATRFIKGLAAAFTAPTSLSLLTTTFPEGPQRNRALSVLTLFGAMGYSSGLILGGLLTDLGWRYIFLMPAPLALLALVAGLLLLPRNRSAKKGGHDPAGAFTLTAGLLLVVYTVVSAPLKGWTSVATLGTLAVAIALLVAFVVIEKRARHPLVRFGMLRHGNMVRANLSIMALVGSYSSFQFMLPLFLQEGRGWSPLHMAFALLPVGVAIAVGSPFAGKLINRFGTAPLVRVSMVSTTLGYGWFLASAGTSPQYMLTMLPSMLLLGGGFAFGYSAIIVQATKGIDDSEQGLASGLVQTSALVGSSLVLAILTVLLTGVGHSGRSFAPYEPGLNLITGIALIGLLLNLIPMQHLQRWTVRKTV
ncbi:MFS transporter [Streptomyces sp. NBC_01619]|uniref:MFS transporter n=1 Tax=Streptomyces sp. NBC_01619 TaxID=2975901 RepID=UPI002255E07B|nr:MFS transporter [Streptomyces sp. NBC_01619]MCX4515750.1 MFS transporter [Streptomyces sp. NBC_01619]